VIGRSVCGILRDHLKNSTRNPAKVQTVGKIGLFFANSLERCLHGRNGMTAHTVDARDFCALDKVDVGDLVQMVKAEYLEMPGLCLTLAQAQRLWTLDRATCVGVLGQLVKSGFLRRSEAGIYERNASDLHFEHTKYPIVFNHGRR
jgi:hypothetical protein